MDFGRPYGVIAHQLDNAALSVLAMTNRPLTGREVAKLAPEGSQQGIWKALTRLVAQGLVERGQVGNAALYRLNRDHILAPVAESIATVMLELQKRLTAEIHSWNLVPVHASLFGPAARGDGDLETTVDVFLVRPEGVAAEDPGWQKQIDQLADLVPGWTGNELEVAEIGLDEIEKLRQERPSVIRALKLEGIHLAGAEAAELFERESPGRPHKA